MEPKLPVRDGHHDVAGLEVFLLPNRARVIFFDEEVSCRAIRGAGFSYFWSTSHSSSLQESRTWPSRGSPPSLFRGYRTRRKLDQRYHTKEGENSSTNGCASLENLLLIRTNSSRMLKYNTRRSRTIPASQRCRS